MLALLGLLHTLGQIFRKYSKLIACNTGGVIKKLAPLKQWLLVLWYLRNFGLRYQSQAFGTLVGTVLNKQDDDLKELTLVYPRCYPPWLFSVLLITRNNHYFPVDFCAQKCHKSCNAYTVAHLRGICIAQNSGAELHILQCGMRACSLQSA